MMIDHSMKGLLTSLSRLNGIHFQLMDENGRILFTCLPESPSLSIKNTAVQLAGKTLIEDSFQFRYDGRSQLLCASPIKTEDDMSSVLMSIEENCPSDNGTVHIENIRQFHTRLISLIEQHLTLNEEVDELVEELDNSFEDLNLYSRIASQIKTLKFSDEMLRSLLRDLLENMRAHMSFASFPDLQKEQMHILKPMAEKEVPDPKDFAERLIQNIPPDEPSLDDHYYILNHSYESPEMSALAKKPFRFLSVKVQHENYSYGWLGLVSFEMNEIFRRGELKLLTAMAEQLAVVIANTNLYRDLERFVINMVRSLVFAIEAKDVYTRGHSERVSYYSMLIGEHLGLPEKETNDLKWASILHDIGKIGIPEHILNKPGKLTDQEFGIIKNHPRKGGEILQPVDQLAASLPGVIHHHERFDGNGYPDGLKGEKIPLTARIIAIADTYDAITSTRAYRDSMQAEKAVAIIKDVAGTQLDPDLVPIFLNLYEKILVHEVN
ncbi:MAG: HD domain-containing protein [Desulfobacteraceae bacterium]|nr:HD domain-containing protein [Desulfobacteraceae bacterium]